MFIVNRPVKREIFASQFRDRVVHHLLFNYLSPLFEARMIFDSYSCRKGKGTSEGIRRIEHHIRSCTHNYTCNAYILELDLKGYFMSISKQRLYDIIHRTLDGSRDSLSPAGIRWQEQLDMDLVDFLLQRIIFRDPMENCEIRGRESDWIGLPPSKSLRQAPDRRRTAYRRSDLATFQQHLSGAIGRVREAEPALQTLRTLCRRFLHHTRKQEPSEGTGAANPTVSPRRTGAGAASEQDPLAALYAGRLFLGRLCKAIPVLSGQKDRRAVP